MISDMKWNPVKSARFFDRRSRIRTALCPATLVLCSVGVAFSQPSF